MYGVASLIVTAILLPLIGSLAVYLRFYVRLRLKPTFVGIDDWLILFSCVLVWGQGANQIVAAVIGELGRDDEKTVEWRVKNEQKLDYATLLIEKVTYTTIKLSVLFFYRRIFLQQKSFRIANDILIALIALWGVVFLFIYAFLCGFDSQHGHPCAPQEWGSLWFAITDVLGDVAILTLPYPCIRRLQMSKRDKIGLSLIFLLGTLSLIFGLIRLGFVAKTFSMYFQPSKSEKSPNRTPPSFWTTIEVSVGLLAACLPPLGPLIRRAPSPLHVYRSIRHGLSRQSSRSSQLSKKLSSNTRIPKTNKVADRVETKEDEHTTEDVEMSNMIHSVSFKEVV